MVQINFALKEVNCKIVYYGPGMSGKTTNLEVVHRKAPIANKGELTSIATEGDRTLFFDFMPLDLGNIAGMRTKFQLYTVPGQVYYNSTRKLVLQGVDGVIFVADSQVGTMDENLESLENLRNNLAEYGKDLNQIPMVLQYNKRDLPNVMDMESMHAKMNPRKLPVFEAVATTGEGVFPTLKALSAMVLESLSKEKRGGGGPPRRRPAPAPAASSTASGRESVAAAAARASEISSSKITPPSTAGSSPRSRQEEARPQPAQARSTDSHPEFGGGPATKKRSPLEDTGGGRILKGTDSFRMPGNGENDAPSDGDGRRDGSGSSSRPDPDASGGYRRPDRGEHPKSSMEPAREKGPDHPAPSAKRAPARPPMVQKFVLEEERGSPLLLIALVFIILIAAGVILYSFKVI